MIKFRHHVVSLVAVFLALAVGVVLGGGPLSDVDESVSGRMSSASDQGARAAAAYTEDFAGAAAPGLVEGTLRQRDVAVLTLPGAEEQLVSSLEKLIGTAGGTVVGHYTLTGTMMDPSSKPLVESLGSQLREQLPQGVVSVDATTYDRIGQLLGAAVASTRPGGEQAGGSAEVLKGLRSADLVGGDADVQRRAPLLLVVLGDEPEGEGATAITNGVVQGMSSKTAGVVVAGSLADADDGQLADLRSDQAATRVTTVDGLDTAAGRTSAVLALSRSEKHPGEAFGAAGEDGPAPLG